MYFKTSVPSVYFLIVLGFYCERSLGAEAQQTPNTKPVLLILEIGSTHEARKREQIFIAELALTLDSYRIVSVNDAKNESFKNFVNQNLKQRLSQIKVLSHAEDAVATVWLEKSGTNVTLLHLVALSTGRALVRIVEAQEGPNTEVTLAMAVDELVGQAYLFDAEKRQPAVESSVISVTNKAISKVNNKGNLNYSHQNDDTPNPKKRFLHVDSIGRAGILGTHGPKMTVGGGLGFEFLMNRISLFSSGFNVILGPFEQSTEQKIKNLGLEPYVGFELFHRLYRSSVGIGLYLAVPWQQTSITLPSTGSHIYHDWNIRFSLELCFRIFLSKTLGLSLSPDLGLWLNKKRYYSEKDNRSIVRNPRLDVGLKMGLFF